MFTANTLDRGELTQPEPSCVGAQPCTLDHGDHAIPATWCVALGDVPPFAACDYHADLLARTLNGLVRVAVTPIELLDQVLDLDVARPILHAADHEHGREQRADDWAPGELSEAWGR